MTIETGRAQEEVEKIKKTKAEENAESLSAGVSDAQVTEEVKNLRKTDTGHSDGNVVDPVKGDGTFTPSVSTPASSIGTPIPSGTIDALQNHGQQNPLIQNAGSVDGSVSGTPGASVNVEPTVDARVPGVAQTQQNQQGQQGVQATTVQGANQENPSNSGSSGSRKPGQDGTDQDGMQADRAVHVSTPTPVSDKGEVRTSIHTDAGKQKDTGDAPVTVTGFKVEDAQPKATSQGTPKQAEKIPEGFVSKQEDKSPPQQQGVKDDSPKTTNPPQTERQVDPVKTQTGEQRREEVQSPKQEPTKSEPAATQKTEPTQSTKSVESPAPPSPTGSQKISEPVVTQQPQQPTQSEQKQESKTEQQTQVQGTKATQPQPVETIKEPGVATTTKSAIAEPKPVEVGLSAENIRQRLMEQKQGEPPAAKAVVTDVKQIVETPKDPKAPIQEKPQAVQAAQGNTDQRRVIEQQNTKQVVESQVTKNIGEIAKTASKAELTKVVTEAIKTALVDGNFSKIAEVIKAALTEPKIREAVRTVIQGSSGGEGSGQPIREVLSKIQATDTEKVRLPVEQAKSIDAITQPVTSKQEAMQVLLGLIVDASKLQNPVVQAVQAETSNKLQAIQGSIDELLKIRLEQFVALSTKAHGVDGGTLQQICNEALQELATRYGLTDEQRALLGRIAVQMQDTDFKTDQPEPKHADKDQLDQDQKHKKDLLSPEAKVLSKLELEKLFSEEIAHLEEFLKERDEVKLKRAKEKLEALLQEAIEEGMNYVIDDDYEVIKTYTIEGTVIDEITGDPVPHVHIYGGLLGTVTTDRFGTFTYLNVPQETVYMIGADQIGKRFKPEYFAGTLTASVQLRFIACVIN